MKTNRSIFATIATLAVLAYAAPASAQATRTWISGVGDDVNPCSRTAPCKTFAGAISKTAAGGIINCLDPGGFGAVTITKSITLDCVGTQGSILSSGVQGVVINAQPNDKIVLRFLDINGAGVTLGTNGVNIFQAGTVQIDQCRIQNYSSAGIRISANAGTTVELHVKDTQILNAGSGAGTGGIVIAPASPFSVGVSLSRVELRDNGFGINSVASGSGAVRVHGSDIVIAGSTNDGIHVGNAGAGALSSFFIDRASIANNAVNGASVDGSTSHLVMGRSSVTYNGTGLSITNGGTIWTYGDNQVNANIGSDGSPNQTLPTR